ncbi:MAG: hypothetical protein R2753_17105 [Chitinophagales bacterium]
MMKKVSVVLIVLISFLSIQHANAQSKCFEKGNILLNPGIGFGTTSAGSGFFWPNFIFSADFGVHDYVSVGPYVATAFGSNGRGAIGVGARSSFHWWQLMDDKVAKDLKQDQFEMYFTIWLGAEILRVKANDEKNNVGGFDAGASLGFRWYPNANERFAFYGEWGRGPISWTTFGATINLN